MVTLGGQTHVYLCVGPFADNEYQRGSQQRVGQTASKCIEQTARHYTSASASCRFIDPSSIARDEPNGRDVGGQWTGTQGREQSEQEGG